MSRSDPLGVAVVDGVLRITIGVDTLAYAIRHSPDFADEDGPQLTIHDPLVFGRAVAFQLVDEIDETGNTLVTEMLETAAEKVSEGGDPSCDWRETGERP